MADVILDRMNNPEYKNWLKFGHCLYYLKTGLCSFSSEVSSDLQADILKTTGINRGAGCMTCIAKDINRNLKFKNPCPNNLCDRLIDEISKHHKHKKAPSKIYWANTDVKKWTFDPWEIAKVYMGQGQKKTNIGPQQTDASNLLTFIDQCVFCDTNYIAVVNKKRATQIKQYRNNLMHSATMKLTEQELQDGMQKVKDFLGDPGINMRQDAKDALDDIKQLETLNFDLKSEEWKNNEANLLQEKMEEFELRLQMVENADTNEDANESQDLASLKKECKDFIKFVEDNKLMLENFNDFKVDTNGRIGNLEHKVTDLEQRVEKIELRRPERNDQGFQTGYNYKKVLNTYAQRKLPSQLPIYDNFASLEDDKWRAKVTIGGKSFPSISSHQSTKLADQEAAYEALKGIGYYDEQELATKRLSSEDNSDMGACARPSVPVESARRDVSDSVILVTEERSKLDRLLKDLGFQNGTYQLKPSGDKYQASVTANVTNAIMLDNPVKTKRDAEQRVAEMILAELQVAHSVNNSSPKEKLHTYCQQNKKDKPFFYSFQTNTEGMVFRCIASMAILRGVHEITVDGDICNSEKECFESAANTMIELLEGVKLKDVVSSSEEMLPMSSALRVNDVTKPKCLVTNSISCGNRAPSSDSTSLILASQENISKNYVSLFHEYIQKSRLSCQPQINCEESETDTKAKTFRGKIANFKPKFKLPINLTGGGATNRKEAEKVLACHVLKNVFNHESPDKSTSKNRLQELCVRYQQQGSLNIPKYDTENLEVVGFTSEVTFLFEVVGDDWHADKQSAKNEVAKKALELVNEL